MPYQKIQNLPEEERPRERLVKYGPNALSTVELIAIILGSGSKTKPILQLAYEVVSRFGGLKHLAQATIAELLEIKGIGLKKAIQLKAALSLGERAARQPFKPKYKIEHPRQAYELVKDELEHEKREIFLVILQDAKGFLIGHEVISIGSLTKALVHPREVFYPAIRHKAGSLIIAHNHPSGDPSPSKEDIQLTDTLLEVSHHISIPLHDHIIVGNQCYVSLRQQGYHFSYNLKKDSTVQKAEKKT